MEHFHNSVDISDAAVTQGKNSLIAFQEESKDNAAPNKRDQIHAAKPSKQYRVVRVLSFF